ncbi:MAG: septation protein IspZ [Nevskia sp.]|nr:septation protein IspZ [Nevskia sp.]
MNAWIDLLPALLFFAAYLWRGLYTATAVLIAACFAQLLVTWLRTRRVHRVQLVVALAAALFGGLTLALRDPAYLQFKPTAIYLLFAAALLVSQFFGDRVLLARLAPKRLALPEAVWRRVNLAWGLFFVLCAALNLYVAAHFSLAAWVRFKVFGFTALTFAFMLAQAPFLARYLEPESEREDAR